MTQINRNIQKSVLTQALSLGLRLSSSVLLARLLGPSERGELALALWVPAVFNSLFYVGLGEGSVALMNRKGYHREQVVGSFHALALIAVAVGALVYVVGAPAVLRLLKGELSPHLYFLALPLFPLTLLWAGWALIHLGLGNVMGVNWGRVINQGALLGVLLLCLSSLRENAGLAVIAALIGAALELVWIGSWLHQRVRLGVVWSPPLQREQLRLGAQTAVALWVGIFSQRLDLMLATWVGGSAGAGFYAVAVGLRDFALVLPETFLRPILSEASASQGAAWFSRIGPAFRRAVLLLAGASIVLGAALPLIVTLLYSREFMPAAAVGRWLLLGFVAFGMSNLLSAILTGLGRLRPFIVSQLAGVAVLLLSAAWCGPRWGIAGIAMAVSLSQWVSVGVLLALIGQRNPGSLRALIGVGAARR